MKGLFKRCSCPNKDRCSCAWWLSFTHEGEAHRLPATKFAKKEVRTKADAVKVLEDFRSAVRAGAYKKDPLPYTWPDYVEYYEERYRDAKALRSESDPYKVQRLKEYFKEYLLADMIRPEPFEKFLQEKLADCKPSTRNRYRALFRAMLRFAKQRELIAHTPFEKGYFPMEREMNERTRRLLPDEETKLLEVAHPDLADAIKLTLDTGLRRGALFSLRPTDVHLDRNLIIVRAETQKHGEGQEIPLTTRANVVLQQRLKLTQKNDPIFLDLAGSFKHLWETAKEKAGLTDTDLHFHDLRAEFASRLGDKGVDLAVGSKLLGHRKIQTTMRYMRPQLPRFQDAIRRLETECDYCHAARTQQA